MEFKGRINLRENFIEGKFLCEQLEVEEAEEENKLEWLNLVRRGLNKVNKAIASHERMP